MEYNLPRLLCAVFQQAEGLYLQWRVLAYSMWYHRHMLISPKPYGFDQ